MTILVNKVNIELHKIKTWFDSNKIELNRTKKKLYDFEICFGLRTS